MNRKFWPIAGLVVLFIAAAVIVASILPKRPDGTTDTPELDEISKFTQAQLDDKLIGLSGDELHHSWGEPDGQGSGFWMDYWHLEDANSIAIYYDADGKAETVKITDGLQ